ncbi:unnamed protein product [Sphagnum troendelagicum]
MKKNPPFIFFLLIFSSFSFIFSLFTCFLLFFYVLLFLHVSLLPTRSFFIFSLSVCSRIFFQCSSLSPCFLATRSVDICTFHVAENVFKTYESLPSDMPDEVLLWRASMQALRPGIPFERNLKIAFMFLSVGPLPLAPLWEQFFRGHEHLYSIYVHAHPGFVPKTPRSSVFYGRYILSQEVRWGEISVIDAERRLLGNALLDFSNERFVLLSETCAPMFNFTFVYDYLIMSQYSFTAIYDEIGPQGRGRYLPNMMPEISQDQWRKGGQWFELQRKHAIAIVSDIKYYPKLRDYCKPHCYIDEHYVQTMMFIEFPREMANRSLTYVDWSRGGPHPAMFGKEDVTLEFLDRIRKDQKCGDIGQPDHACYLFARKFSPGSLEPLLKLLHFS